MTRAEFLAAARQKFIDEHLRPPGWIARLPAWLQPYPLILYWTFFRPSAIRLYLQRLAPELDGTEGDRDRLRAFRKKPALRRFLFPALVVTIATPFLVTTLTGLVTNALGFEFDWGGSLANVAVGVAVGVAGGVGAIAGALRLPFFALGLPAAARGSIRQTPIGWDELPVLPQPGLARRLARLTQENLALGLREAAFVARHPFARWATRRGLSDFLQRRPEAFFPALLQLLSEPLPYVEPVAAVDIDVRRREADPYFSAKLVLAELGGARMVSDPGRLARALTAPLRGKVPPDMAAVARGLYELLEVVDPLEPRRRRQFDPETLLEPLSRPGLRRLPGGEEFYQSYRTIFEWLEIDGGELPADDLSRSAKADRPRPSAFPFPIRWKSIRALSRAGISNLQSLISTPSAIEFPLRPDLLALFRRLREVSESVAAYQATTSELAKRDHLVRAQRGLDAVREAAKEAPQPDEGLFTQIADGWRDIISGEQERVATPIVVALLDNFYVAGPPLTPEAGRLFVGRAEVFRQIEELWRNPYQKQAVVLHGQRRMGKTSILNHLQKSLGPTYLPVMADLQGISAELKSEADLWDALIRTMTRALSRAGISNLQSPISTPSAKSLDAFLDSLEDSLSPDRYLVLLLDEFEKLEQKIDEGVVTPAFLDYLRSAIQHRRQVLVVLAGHHTLEERLAKYWSPLMGVARPVHVSYLDEDAADRLITNPWDGFRLSYTADALARLKSATGLQPMLLQQACSAVIEVVNERLAKSGGEEYPEATLAEAEAALDRLTARESTYYFDAVWDWLAEAERAALVALARAPGSGEGWAAPGEVGGGVGRGTYPYQAMLDRLVTREVLARDAGRYRCRVELFNRWIGAHR